MFRCSSNFVGGLACWSELIISSVFYPFGGCYFADSHRARNLSESCEPLVITGFWQTMMNGSCISGF